MRHRFLVSSAMFTATIVVGVWARATVEGQQAAASRPAPGAKTTWTPPKTSWGEPDLQGKWSYATITPLERPASLADRETLSDAEVADLNEGARTNADRRDGGADADLARAYNAHWYDRGKSIGRTSLIVDPPDGRLPPMTAEGRARQAARAAEQAGHEYDSWENRPLPERCITYHGVPPLPTGYNNTYQIFQTPGLVVILDENIHDVRTIRLDGRPHLGPNLRQWDGNSIGRWDGNTLVVETTNYRAASAFRFPVAAESVRATERFTRAAPGRIDYRFTIDDRATYTRPWTAAIPLQGIPDYTIFEYACHEGNYSIRNVLSGARMQERQR
jgi:hypothetical protein